MDTIGKHPMSIADQALYLLDISSSVRGRRHLEAFSNLDPIILSSFGVEETKEKAPESLINQTPFSVASRLSRSNYEDQARAEALMTALKKLRNRNNATSAPKSSRVIREL